MIAKDDISQTSADTERPQSSGRSKVAHLQVSPRNLAKAQSGIFQYLLDIVKTWPSDDVLDEFKQLFIDCGSLCDDLTSDSKLLTAMRTIAVANQEGEFKNTLKRACYILINNWDISRNHEAIGQLIQLFSDSSIRKPLKRPLFKRLRRWLQNFIASNDFKELTLFAARYDDFEKLHWSQRYTSYLLVSQYTNLKNSVEQREAAQALSHQLKERFKADLALYTAYSDSLVAQSDQDRAKDPTALGENSLQLIKRILVCRGPFSYEHLANIFRKQSMGLSHEQFKRDLQVYLLQSLPDDAVSAALGRQVGKRLACLYPNYSDRSIDDALLLRSCNRVIKWLTTEDHKNPSDIFVWLIAKGSPLSIVILLLRLLLVCRKARTHLESRIADLVRHYEDYPEEECRGVIDFFEIFNVTMTVYSEDIRYSLVNVDGSPPSEASLEAYRIFSQIKYHHPDADANGDRDAVDIADHLMEDFVEGQGARFRDDADQWL
ncbi:MAG: hypothetical protein ACFB5Z_07560 [Elainellaceae cyanobacterium]